MEVERCFAFGNVHWKKFEMGRNILTNCSTTKMMLILCIDCNGLGKNVFFFQKHTHGTHDRHEKWKKSNFIRESSLFGQIVLLRKHVWHILPFSIQLQSGIRITFLLLWTFMSSPQSLFRVLQKLNKRKRNRTERESLLRTISPERICSFLERK